MVTELAKKLHPDTIVTSTTVFTVVGHVQREIGAQVLVTVYLPSYGCQSIIDLLKEDIGGVSVGVKAEQIIYSDIVGTLNGKHLPSRFVSTK